VLAITGHHFHDLIDTFAQQDVNLDRVFADVAVYSTRVMGPTHVENVTELACRTAIARRGVASPGPELQVFGPGGVSASGSGRRFDMGMRHAAERAEQPAIDEMSDQGANHGQHPAGIHVEYSGSSHGHHDDLGGQPERRAERHAAHGW
jgi:hypothetical protein